MNRPARVSCIVEVGVAVAHLGSTHREHLQRGLPRAAASETSLNVCQGLAKRHQCHSARVAVNGIGRRRELDCGWPRHSQLGQSRLRAGSRHCMSANHLRSIADDSSALGAAEVSDAERGRVASGDWWRKLCAHQNKEAATLQYLLLSYLACWALMLLEGSVCASATKSDRRCPRRGNDSRAWRRTARGLVPPAVRQFCSM